MGIDKQVRKYVVLIAVFALALCVAGVALAVSGGTSIDGAVTTTSGVSLANPAFTGTGHNVYKIVLVEGDQLGLHGGAGGFGGTLTVDLYGPGTLDIVGTVGAAMSINVPTNATPFAIEQTHTVTVGNAGTYYIDVDYSDILGGGQYTFTPVVAGAGGGAPGAPVVTVLPEAVDFYAKMGGGNPAPQQITVTIGGWDAPVVNWRLSNIPEWLTIEPSFGTAPGSTTMTISVDVSKFTSAISTDVAIGVDVDEPVFGPPVGPTSVKDRVSIASPVPTEPDKVIPVSLDLKYQPTMPVFSATWARSYWASTSAPLVRMAGRVACTPQLGDPITAAQLISGPVVFYAKPVGGNWTQVGSTYTAADGSFSANIPVSRTSVVKAKFMGNDYAMYVYSPYTDTSPKFTPMALITQPYVSSATVRRGRAFTMSGYLYPGHSSASQVRLYAYRYERGRWVLRKSSIYARRAAYSAGKSKWSVSTTLPSTGRWRVRAAHGGGLFSDYDHLRTYSAYRYLTVK